MKISIVFFVLNVLMFFTFGFAQSPITINPSTTRHGPENGSLIIIGGGAITPDIWAKFNELQKYDLGLRSVIKTKSNK